MTLQEIRDKIAATKAKLREVLPNAETDEQRAEVSTLEERLNSEEAELTDAQKWDEQQQRLPGSSVDRDLDGAGPSAAYEGKRPGSRSRGQGARGSRSDSGVRRRHAEQPRSSLGFRVPLAPPDGG